MTYLEVAQQSFDRVRTKAEIDLKTYGTLPKGEMLELAKVAALIDIASSLFEIQLILQRKEGGR